MLSVGERDASVVRTGPKSSAIITAPGEKCGLVHPSPSTVVVTDASVLVNFLRVDRTHLIAGLSHHFTVIDHVADEVSDRFPDQQQRLTSAIDTGILTQLSVTSRDELSLFASLSASGRLGAGERSAIAVAVQRQHILAIDDRRAIAEARRTDRTIRIHSTQDLMVSMIGEGFCSAPPNRQVHRDVDRGLSLSVAKHVPQPCSGRRGVAVRTADSFTDGPFSQATFHLFTPRHCLGSPLELPRWVSPVELRWVSPVELPVELVSRGRTPARRVGLGRRALLSLATVGTALRRHTGCARRSRPGRRRHALSVRTRTVGARLTETRASARDTHSEGGPVAASGQQVSRVKPLAEPTVGVPSVARKNAFPRTTLPPYPSLSSFIVM